MPAACWAWTRRSRRRRPRRPEGPPRPFRRLTPPWPLTEPTAAHRAAYADAQPRSFWLDRLPDRSPHEPLAEAADADLCIVGGGFTGLWAALQAKARTPAREVVLLEATRCGAGASGRNGGFLEASLTHGLSNGLARFPEEMDELERLGLDNFKSLRGDLERLQIDCDYEATGNLTVALEPHELADLQEQAVLLRRFGHDMTRLDGEQVRSELNSPTYLAGLPTTAGTDPQVRGAGLRLCAHDRAPDRGSAALDRLGDPAGGE